MPMIEGVQTDLALMEDTAGQVRRTYGELQMLLAELTSQVNSMQGRWMGMAGERFQEAAREHKIASDLLHEALRDLGEAMDFSGVNTGSADTQSSKTIEGATAAFTMAALREA